MQATDQVCDLGQGILEPELQYLLLKNKNKIESKNGFIVKVKLYMHKNSWHIERTILVSATINRRGN